MSRHRKRKALSLGWLLVAPVVIALGFNGWHLGHTPIPAQYLGYLFLLIGVLGLAGVNIWKGGPLDPRNDPPDES